MAEILIIDKVIKESGTHISSSYKIPVDYKDKMEFIVDINEQDMTKTGTKIIMALEIEREQDVWFRKAAITYSGKSDNDLIKPMFGLHNMGRYAGMDIRLVLEIENQLSIGVTLRTF